jgi:hypothetical protein
MMPNNTDAWKCSKISERDINNQILLSKWLHEGNFIIQ